MCCFGLGFNRLKCLLNTEAKSWTVSSYHFNSIVSNLLLSFFECTPKFALKLSATN